MNPSFYWGKVNNKDLCEKRNDNGINYYFPGFELHIQSENPHLIVDEENTFLVLWGKPKLAVNQRNFTEALTQLIQVVTFKAAELPLTGSFSGVMWNKKSRTLFLISDPMGIKRIFHTKSGEVLIFSSHSGVVARLANLSKMSPRAMEFMLTLRGIPSPDSFFDQVISLKPSEIMQVSQNSLSCHSYFPLENELLEKQEISYPDAKSLLSKIMIENLFTLCEGKRPAISLSGGVDSLYLAALGLANKIPLTAKTVGFFPATPEDEVDRAVSISESLGIKLEIIRQKDDQYLATFFDHLVCFPEPDADPTNVLELTLGLVARDSTDLLLDGTGADNIFCSLDKFKARQMADMISLIPKNIRAKIIFPILESLPAGRQNKLSNLTRRAMKILLGIENAGTTEFKKEIYWAHAMAPGTANNFFASAAQFHPSHYPSDIFLNYLYNHACNTISNAKRSSFIGVRGTLPIHAFRKISSIPDLTGLDIDLPYMIPNFVITTMNLPDRYKISHSKTKIILKDLVNEIKPKGLRLYPKGSFSPPIKRWLTGPLLFDLQRLVRDEIDLDSGFISRIVLEMITGKQDWQRELWIVYSALKWKEVILSYNFCL